MARKQPTRDEYVAPVYTEAVMLPVLDEDGDPVLDGNGDVTMAQPLNEFGDPMIRWEPGMVVDGEVVKCGCIPPSVIDAYHLHEAIQSAHRGGIMAALAAVEAADDADKPALQATADSLRAAYHAACAAVPNEYRMKVPTKCGHCKGRGKVRKHPDLEVAKVADPDARRKLRRAKMVCPTCSGEPTMKPAGWTKAVI